MTLVIIHHWLVTFAIMSCWAHFRILEFWRMYLFGDIFFLPLELSIKMTNIWYLKNKTVERKKTEEKQDLNVLEFF